MNNLQKYIGTVFGVGLSLSTLTGCKPSERVIKEHSDLMQEKGYVVDNLHSDGYHKSKLSMGMTMKGKLTFTPTSITVPETWGVVFRCEHENKFVISGSIQRHKDLWSKLDPQTEVTIDYKEIYRTTYKDVDNDGEVDDVFSRELIDYDFIDANPIKK